MGVMTLSLQGRRLLISAFLYGGALLYLLFQGGKTAVMLFVIMNALLLYLLLGRFSGISKVSGSRSLRKSGGGHGDYALAAGSSLTVKLSVKVPGYYPIPFVLVRDQLLRNNGQALQFESSFVPNLKRSGEVLYTTPPLQRGEYRFGATACSSHDVFGLFEHSGSFTEESIFSVMPQIVPLRQQRGLQLGARGPYSHAIASRSAKETTQINGVREYVPGDRLSRIHWHATARTGHWKSKEFERESLPRTLIIIDRDAKAYSGARADRFELAVSAAASLIESSGRGETAMGLLSAGSQRSIFPPKAGAEQRGAIMQHLTAVNADAEQPLYQTLLASESLLNSGSIALVISTASGKEASASLEWLARKGLQPCLLHIADVDGRAAAMNQDWQKLLRARGWPVFTLTQLPELPAVLEGGGGA